MKKIIVAVGGGEIRSKTTLEIDRYVAGLAKEHAGDKRANALFIGTASHDSMPYFNSFRKTYTSVFDIKAEVALIVYGEMDIKRISEKIAAADMLYIGGGNTLFMLEKWRETGLDKLIVDAYEDGKIICGLSAGAICWFKDMYSDALIMDGKSDEYEIFAGMGIIDGTMCPHFNEREKDFFSAMAEKHINNAYCVENDAAAVFENGSFARSVSAGGKVFFAENRGGIITKREL